jgi:hypothetical protein
VRIQINNNNENTHQEVSQTLANGGKEIRFLRYKPDKKMDGNFF